MSNPVQERHLKNLDGELQSLHSGYLSLHAKQEYPTTVDELNLGHLQVKLLEIVAAWSQGRPPKNCAPKSPPTPAPPPPPPHRQRLLNIVLAVQPSHSHASRHGPEVLHGFRRAAGQHEHLVD